MTGIGLEQWLDNITANGERYFKQRMFDDRFPSADICQGDGYIGLLPSQTFGHFCWTYSQRPFLERDCKESRTVV
jgi:hypothetical protein